MQHTASSVLSLFWGSVFSLSVGMAAWAGEVVELEGQAQLIRDGLAQTLEQGMKVQRGDLLLPMETAKVTILCDNQRLWRVPSGTMSGLGVGCPSRNTFRGIDSQYGPGGLDPTLPFIVSPRKTLIVAGDPLLQWNPVADAEMYLVQVRQAETVLWQATTPDTEIRYPAQPLLQPGIEYRVTVETLSENGVGEFSDHDAGGPLVFERLDEEQVQQVADAIGQVRTSNWSPILEVGAIAHIYQTHQLYADAIATLEAGLQRLPPTAQIHQQLGHLYGIVQLTPQAETHYQQAIALAEADEQLELLAHAQVGLADIKQVMGDVAGRHRALEDAIVTYERLGDQAQAAHLRAILPL